MMQRLLKVKKALIDKEISWLKNNQRALHFYFFSILEYQNNRSQVVAENINSILDHKNNEVANQWMHELEIPADIIKVPVSKIDVTELTVHELTEDNSKWESGSTNDISFEEIEKIIDGFERTSSIEGAYGISFGDTVNGISSVYDYVSCFLSENNGGLSECNISNINKKWVIAYSQFPEAFSWVDKNNEQQTIWLMKFMKKKLVSVPLKPLNNMQRINFIIATFDFWCGWDDHQLAKLKKGRAKISSSFSSLSKDFDVRNHKFVFLQEVEKAWKQKELRCKKKNEKPKLQMTAKTMEYLLFIARVHEVSPKEMLSTLISDAYLDIVGSSGKLPKRKH
ncbi:hypothetical protein [Yersinia ruckeri]|uniref:hypothetical protein n=2 Tax=Yersinia ruckeri TaxID=29486 RepID=UPI001FE7AC70|nr:hypothetical protein [Yersinia ruckeri]